MNERHDDLQEIIDAALREMAAEEGDGFDPQACNLAEFCRRTGLTRSRARTVRAHGFRALPHGNSGRRTASGVLAGHTGLVDDLCVSSRGFEQKEHRKLSSLSIGSAHAF